MQLLIKAANGFGTPGTVLIIPLFPKRDDQNGSRCPLLKALLKAAASCKTGIDIIV
jgi:hypothetical protein